MFISIACGHLKLIRLRNDKQISLLFDIIRDTDRKQQLDLEKL